MTARTAWAVAAALAWPASAVGQLERYEAGTRLRAFESAWEAADAAGRLRANEHMNRAIQSFFTARMGEAARNMDLARSATTSTETPTPAAQWAASLSFQPAARLLDVAQAAVTVRVEHFYPPKSPAPAGAVVRLRWLDAAGVALGEPFTMPLTAAPAQAVVSLPKPARPADVSLEAAVSASGVTLMTRAVGVSLVEAPTARLSALKLAAAGPPLLAAGTDPATFRLLLATLKYLAEGNATETDYPAARLLAETEELARAVAAGRRYYGADRTGQFWLSLPPADGSKLTTPTRVQVPAGVSAERPAPLLIALHGAGGSENLFFDGYGAGKTAKFCAERGWVMAAPRSPGLFGNVPIEKIVDELAAVYPVDRSRVYLMGHSMGAAQTAAALQQVPTRLAAAAMLGGGGGVRNAEAARQVPAFVGCGADDFALGGAKALARALEKAGGKDVQFKEYAGIEHTTVVQYALPDVFAFFEKRARR